MKQRSWYPWVGILFVPALLLGGCGPETLPEGLSSQSQVQPPSNRQPAASNTVVASALTLAVPDTSMPLTPTVGTAQPSPTVAVTTTLSAEIASPIIPSLAFTDPATVDIFQIAQELFAAGDDAFPIEVTLGDGEESMQIKASKPELINLPCFPRQPAPQGSDYLCQLGGGLESEVWLATWGQGLKRLVTDQAMGAVAWSDDGSRIAFATLAGQDEAGNVPLKVLDLETDQEKVVGMMSSPYQMAFTPNDQLIYLADNAIQVVAVPRELTQDVSLVKTIPLADIPDNQAYLSSSAAWFKVSPSGDMVAIMREWGGATGKLTVLDIANGQETVIDDQVRNGAYSLPNIYAWSPDGNTLAYLTMVEEGSVEEQTITDFSELWLTDANGDNRRRIWRSDRPFLGYTDLDWLPDSRTLVMSADEQAFSDLVQVVHASDGVSHSLFQGGKGVILFELRPGLATLLMPTIFDMTVPRYDVVILSY